MEHNEIQWVGAPCCLRGSFAFYKSFRRRAEAGQGPRVWSLGQFYFVRCGPQEPVCIAELTLLWEDQAQRHLLASSRLYFLPEDTPKGRSREHGEDEVLAVSKKIVMRVEDLVRWTCTELPCWKRSSQEMCGCSTTCDGTQSCAPGASGPTAEKAEGRLSVMRQSVKVLSYPQYCRFRSLQRRIQNVGAQRPLQDPHLLALGGLRLAQRNALIFYCRDTFNHPSLENNTSIWTHPGFTSLSLKGRPRKRKHMDGRGLQYQSQSSSWMERMKENVMGSVEMQSESGWLPHPEEQHFLDQLYIFMEKRGSPISKVPKLGFKKVDLFLLFSVVKKLGGYEMVTSQRLWKRVYDELGGNPGSTSAATCTRRHYEKLILPYEQQMKGRSAEPSKPQGCAARGLSMETGQAVDKVKAVRTAESDEKQGGRALVRRGRPRGRRQSKSSARAPPTKAASQQAGRAVPPQLPLPVLPPVDLTSLHDGSPPEPESLSLTDSKLGLCSEDKETQSVTPQDSAQRQGVDELRATPALEQKLEVGAAGPQPPQLPISLPPQRANGSLAGDWPPENRSSLEHLRTRLGLTAVSSSSSVSQEPSAPSRCASQLHGLADSPDGNQNHLKWQRHSSPSNNDGSFRCHADCVSLDGLCKIPEPLKVLPLDINCSLQVHHLMRTPPGSSQLSSFGRKLSEALAQDLSVACRTVSPFPGLQEQTCPLNLSKRSSTKRPASDLEPEIRDNCQRDGDPPCSAKRVKIKQEPADDSGPVLDINGCGLCPPAQEGPADLRVRQQLKDSPHAHAAQEEGLTLGHSAARTDHQCALLAGVKEDHPSRSLVQFCGAAGQVEAGAEPDLMGRGGCASYGRTTRTMARLKSQVVEVGK